MGRSPCCSKDADLNRGAWTANEDMILKEYVTTHGETGWKSLPKIAGLKRCGKSCRLRWLNYLRPDIKRGNISSDEDELIIRLHGLLGNRWSLIAGRLPGRTDNEIKNYWNTHLSKKTLSCEKPLPKPSAGPDNSELKITPVKATAVRVTNVCRKYAGSGYSNHETTVSVKTVKSSGTLSQFPEGQVMTNYKTELMKPTMAAESESSFPDISGQYSIEDFTMDELQGSSCDFIEMSALYNSFGQDENFIDDDWVNDFQDFQMSTMLLSESEEGDFSIGMRSTSSLQIHRKV